MRHDLEELAALHLSHTVLGTVCHFHRLQLHDLHLASGDKLGCLKPPEIWTKVFSFKVSIILIHSFL